MPGLFRCSGDIIFEDAQPQKGKISAIQLKQFSETCNFLQCLKPLTKENPYFVAQIQNLAPNSKVTIGIAGPDISDEAHPGHWNNTVGYHSNGRCFSSHFCDGNTDGQAFGAGDAFGVLVTHFGKKMSTVIFLKNGNPVATRYIFEMDHNKFLPTLALENGPIDLGLLWPESIVEVPTYSEKNMRHWIRPPGVNYDETEDMFFMTNKNKDLILQSPLPLSKEIQHFEIMIQECNDYGAGPTIAIAMCSPLKHKATLDLTNDYFMFSPDGKSLKVNPGQRMGWGILYDSKSRTADDREEQLVLCYVTIDTNIVFTKLMMQPAGGWYPLILLHPHSPMVKIDMETNPQIKITSDLEFDLVTGIKHSKQICDQDTKKREVGMGMFRKSEELKVTQDATYTHVLLSGEQPGIHSIQFLQPLTPDNSYFCVEVNKIGDSSIVVIGLADPDFPLNRYPGKAEQTVGYFSRDGKLFTNGKDSGNTCGARFSAGDIIGLEVEVFEEKMSVALFSKNGRPVGTRYHFQKDHRKFLPTISVFAAEEDVDLSIVWQNRIGMPPLFDMTNIEEWCLPEDAVVNKSTNTVFLEGGNACIQPAYSLNRSYNHFEIVLSDELDENHPPPAVALSTASPISPPPVSKFKADFIFFNTAKVVGKLVNKGDKIGWGVLYPDNRFHDDKEQMVICYLTVNGSVAMVRVLFQPPGGFYPVIILHTGVEETQLDFNSLVIEEHPFTLETVQSLVKEAREMISEEGILTYDKINDTFTADETDVKKRSVLQKGKRFTSNDLLDEKLLQTVPEIGENDVKFKDETIPQRRRLPKRHPKMLNLVDQMMEQQSLQKHEREPRGRARRSGMCQIL